MCKNGNMWYPPINYLFVGWLSPVGLGKNTFLGDQGGWGLFSDEFPLFAFGLSSDDVLLFN